jgi:hypothetical protein
MVEAIAIGAFVSMFGLFVIIPTVVKRRNRGADLDEG